MIKSSLQLHALIQAMDVGEQRFFRRFASRHVIGDENLYLKLFEAIREQPVYEEDALLGLWGAARPKRRFTLAKHYLLNLVLEGLRWQHRGKTLGLYLREQLDYVELLYEKGQGDLGLRWVRKSKVKAVALCEPLALLELIRWEKKLVRWKGGERLAADLAALVEEEGACLAQLQTELTLQGIVDRLYGLVVQRMSAPDAVSMELLADLMGHPLLQEGPEGLSREGQLAYHFAYAYSHQLKGAYGEYLLAFRAMVAIWETWPEKQQWAPARFIKTLYVYLDGCYQVGEVDAFEETLPVIEAFAPREKKNQALHFSLVNHLRLRHFLNTAQFESALALEPELVRGLSVYQGFLNPGMVLSFLYNLGVLFFVLEDFKRSVSWLNKIIHHKHVDARLDLQAASRVLQLICHLELGNTDLFSSLLPAARRYLGQHLGKGDFVRVFLRGLGRLSGLVASERGAVFEGFQEALEGVLAEMKPGLLCGVEVLAWVRASRFGTRLRDEIGA